MARGKRGGHGLHHHIAGHGLHLHRMRGHGLHHHHHHHSHSKGGCAGCGGCGEDAFDFDEFVSNSMPPEILNGVYKFKGSDLSAITYFGEFNNFYHQKVIEN